MMLDRVLARLRDEKDLMPIVRDTGLQYSWLRQLRQGRFADPGVKKIERLDYYFKTRETA